MSNKTYTLIVVPDHTSAVRRYRVQKNLMVQLAGGLLLIAALIAGAAVHYLSVAKDASENQVLREENLALRTQLKQVRERVEHIGSTLDRVERFDQKLRAVTLLNDPRRNLAMGPIERAPDAPNQAEIHFAQQEKELRSEVMLDSLDKLSATATRQEQSLQELQDYFLDQKALLSSTPSMWPARGWVTSDFGQRVDPYTASRVMHSGLDIAAAHGERIIAPSDGTVTYAGMEGGYGNVVVLDHGYGLKTRYAHLSRIMVKPGEKVVRGAQIGAVGNTGRSTGPHLHYEVRLNGVPQNPRQFILEE